MPGIETDHPHLLLWYVSGDLPAEQHRETEAHLATCASCLREVQAIRTMLETVREEDRAARESSRFADTGAISASAAPARKAGGSEAGTAAASPRAVTGWALAGIGFAAGLVLGGMIGVRLPEEPPVQRPALLTAVGTAVLTPPMRGGGHAPALTPPGPWVATVVLPYGGPYGPCAVSITREDGSRAEQPTSASPDADGTFTVLIPSMEGPAALELLVEPSLAAAGESWRYPFEIAPAAGAAKPPAAP